MRLVFVHGALVRDGKWWWSRMTPLLAAAGISSVAAELPSCDGSGDLYDDAEAVRTLLRESDEPTMLVGHSYGGAVITEAAQPPVRRLVYIDAFLPDVDEPLGVGPFLEPPRRGRVRLRQELASLFVHDCDEDVVAEAAQRLTDQSSVVFTQSVRAVGWREIPSTYVVCANDLATPPEVQRAQALRATDVVELPTGHHPFLSHPQLLAAVVVKAAA